VAKEAGRSSKKSWICGRGFEPRRTGSSVA